MSPIDRAKHIAEKLKISQKVLNDAFRILDTIQDVSKEMRGEWPDIEDASDWWGEAGNEGGFTIPGKFRGVYKPIRTHVPVNVIPTNKNNSRGGCHPILFVHIKQKTNSTKQQEIITEAGQHVSDICPNTQIIIIHGTMDYYVWNNARHQLKNQLVFLQPIRHSYLVLDPDWR